MNTAYLERSFATTPFPVGNGYPLERRRVKKDGALFRPSRFVPAVFVLMACLVPCVPEVWTRGRQLGPLGLEGSMWSAMSMLCVASLCIRLRQSWVTIVSVLGMCAMIILGIVESQVLNVDLIVGDIFVFAAIPVGAAWAFTTTESERRLFLRILYGANWAMLAGIDWLLMHHAIQRSQPGPRVFVYSEFYCTWALAVLTPFIYFDRDLWRGRRKIVAQIALVAMTLLMAWTAYISITRSVLFQLTMSLVVTAAGLVKFRRLSVRWSMVGLMAATALVGLLVTVQSNKSLSFEHGTSNRSLEQRVFSTDLTREERITELYQLLSEYGGDLLVGRGLGSGFRSVTFSKLDTNFAPAPHIAVFTLLMKGGVVAFVLGIVLPAALAFYTILGTRDPELYASCAGVLMYVVLSSISGGWTFPQLFGYGFFLSHMTNLIARSRASRRCGPELRKRLAADHPKSEVQTI